jgi:transcriptional regulator with XRE-family HTH domain
MVRRGLYNMPSSLSVPRAVRELRHSLHESQQAFAYRMKTAIRTIARYETIRPPRGSVLAQLEEVAMEAGRADLAAVFRQALAEELGSPSQLMSPEERAWSQVICNLLRNRQRGDLGSVRVRILDELIRAQSHLLAWAQAGQPLGRTAAQLQNDLRNLEIAAQGTALYETKAAAKRRSQQEQISPEQAFAKELTPERYERHEREHRELDLGLKKKKKGAK